jgi:hypothetical protein
VQLQRVTVGLPCLRVVINGTPVLTPQPILRSHTPTLNQSLRIQPIWMDRWRRNAISRQSESSRPGRPSRPEQQSADGTPALVPRDVP